MVDVGVAAPELKKGGDVHGEVRVRPAGAGANAAVWAAWSGASVRLFGRVGDDLTGRLLQEALTERGVDLAVTVDRSAPTGTMLVVTEAGERSMVADRGANAHLSPEDIPPELEAGAVLLSGYLLFHPGSEPAAVAALERARADWVAVDAASWPLIEQYGGKRFTEATEPANVLLANEREAEVLGGAARLTDMYEHVFIKQGDLGATYHSGGPSLSVVLGTISPPVDATGAGDAFDGALLAALARGSIPKDALHRACEAGALCAASPETWPER